MPEEKDVSETTAPSIGPNTVIEKDDPGERLSRHQQSEVDAMGLDKRREVIGGRYSASATRQILTYAIVVLVVAGANRLAVGCETGPRRRSRSRSRRPSC